MEADSVPLVPPAALSASANNPLPGIVCLPALQMHGSVSQWPKFVRAGPWHARVGILKQPSVGALFPLVAV